VLHCNISLYFLAALQKSGVLPIFNRMRLPQSLDRRWKRAEAAFSALLDRGHRRGAVATVRRAAPAQEKARPCAPAAESAPAPAKSTAVGLALQGGGAHGAFTWGVLDRLFEADVLRVGAISGASAGALNAAVAADGLLAGGPDGARAALEGFWRTVSAHGAFTPYTALDKMINGWNQDGTGRQLSIDIASRLVSPYQFNPLGHNPLRDILNSSVDFERLRRNRRVKLYIAATDVRTGQAKIFRTSQLSVDVLLASAALPSLHHAVEIDGVPYWDGGFSANPPLIPLVEKGGCEDILLVQVEPPHDDDLPVTATAIRSRLARLTFMAPLNRELDALRWVGKVSASENGPAASAVRMHRIDSGDGLNALGQFSKLNPEWGMLQHVRDIGRKRAETWLARKAQHVGDRATFRL
jgi:NTE family protein